MSNIITIKNIIPRYKNQFIRDSIDSPDVLYKKLHKYFYSKLNIESSIDQDVVNSYSKDWSNIPGYANMLLKPSDKFECAKILKTCYINKIPITISAGKTNLTGSATSNGGIILSINKLNNLKEILLDQKSKQASTPVGLPLEEFRKEILRLSKNKLYYPVDPTSRNDALVGGTVSCNASGFIPGEKGATRYWVSEIEMLLPNGSFIKAERGEFISKSGIFILSNGTNQISLPVPKYKRPNLKNASGPYSDPKGEIDFVDLVVGSEGIYGLITSCKFNLANKPKDYLELFLCLPNENKAINFHDFLYSHFKGAMHKISALEYFGFNSQKYMKHQEFLFNNKEDVGIYLQVPIYNKSIESKSEEWIELINQFDKNIDVDSIIVLNDPLNWKKFFEARHSIPDNALTKTKRLGGISIITDTIVPPENYRKYLDSIHKKLQKEKIEYLLFGHLGDCHLHFHLIPSDKQEDKCLEIYDYMVDLSTELGGVYSAEHGTGKRKRNDFKKCYGEKAVEMVRKSKLAVDPDLILNRGNVFN